MNKNLINRIKNLNKEQLVSLLREASGKVEGARSRWTNQERFPLSLSQQRAWFLSLFQEDDRPYYIPLTLRIKTHLPILPELFQKSLEALVKDHEILRTTFHEERGEAFQKVHVSMDVFVFLEETSYSEVKKKIKTLFNQGFDVQKGPLMLLAIYSLGNGEYVFFLLTHHLISDAWTNRILLNSLITNYGNLLQNKSLPRMLPRKQYVDYVLWEREHLDSPLFIESLSFWKKKLYGYLGAFEVPPEKEKGEIYSPSGSLVSNVLNIHTFQMLKSFSKEQLVTPFVTFLVTYQLLLYLYTRQRDIVIGFPVANRMQKEFADTFGFFSNTITCRSQINPRDTVEEYLQRTMQDVQEILTHQQVPFEKIVQELNPERVMGRHPFFQIFFTYQNQMTDIPIQGLSSTMFHIDFHMTKFDINLWVEEYQEEIHLLLFYRTQLYSSEFMHQFTEHFEQLLLQVMEKPFNPISTFSLGAGKSPSPHQPMSSLSSFIRLFESAVRQTPDHVAIEYRNERLTYQELNAQANQLARLLQNKGVKLQQEVALMIDLSPLFFIALIAIWKINAVYVPMDLRVFAERGAHFFLLDDHFIKEHLMSFPEETDNLELRADEKYLAYIIYTSGSTGAPKAVGVEHRQLSVYLEAIHEVLGSFQCERFSLFNPITTDLGNSQIFYPLVHGKTVVIAPVQEMKDPDLLHRFILESRIDCIKMVPSHMHIYLQKKDTSCVFPALVYLAGEKCSVQLVENIIALAPKTRILIGYGPTETTVSSAIHVVDEGDHFDFPLGKTLSHAQMFLLDTHLDPVPPGIIGELFVGGGGVARGYLERPDLTAASFLPNPYAAHPGERMYKTGDLGRYRADGKIQFLGRRDREIKIRGFRAHLQEIETSLLQHPSVQQAVVLWKKDQEKLFAYLVMHDSKKVTIREISTFLQQRLPSHMIPGEWFFLQTMPIRESGKIDFQVLEQIATQTGTPISAVPHDPVERKLVEIWQRLLRKPNIGIDDDFFVAGGHSFLAVQLIHEIEQEFLVKFSLAALFHHRTVQSLAELIRMRQAQHFDEPIICIQSEGELSPLFFVHPAGGNVLCYMELAEAFRGERPFFGLQDTFGGHRTKPSTIEDLAKKYRQALPTPKGRLILGGWSMGALVAFEMARISSTEADIIIIDQKAHHNVEDLKHIEDDTWQLLDYLNKIEQFLQQELGFTYEELAGLSFDVQVALIYQRFLKLEISPLLGVGEKQFGQFLMMQKDHYVASKQYIPKPITSRILLVRATESHLYEREDLGWQQYTSIPVEIVWMKGNHFSLLSSPQVNELARIIDQWIRE